MPELSNKLPRGRQADPKSDAPSQQEAKTSQLEKPPQSF